MIYFTGTVLELMSEQTFSAPRKRLTQSDFIGCGAKDSNHFSSKAEWSEGEDGHVLSQKS
jgi:hypothetical protein